MDSVMQKCVNSTAKLLCGILVTILVQDYPSAVDGPRLLDKHLNSKLLLQRNEIMATSLGYSLFLNSFQYIR